MSILDNIGEFVTLQECQDWQVKASEDSRQLQLRNVDKDVYSNPYRREYDRVSMVIELFENGADNIQPTHQGALVNEHYVVAWSGAQWRVQGKNRWYLLKNIPHFMMNYVLNKPDFEKKKQFLPLPIYTMSKWNDNISFQENHTGYVLNGKYLIAKHKQLIRPLSFLDWAWYTPKGLAVALLEDTVDSYYENMLHDPRSPANEWKRPEEEMQKKAKYAERAGRASLI